MIVVTFNNVGDDGAIDHESEAIRECSDVDSVQAFVGSEIRRRVEQAYTAFDITVEILP